MSGNKMRERIVEELREFGVNAKAGLSNITKRVLLCFTASTI